MTTRLDNLYAHRSIVVLSTGTSLRGFDFTRLNACITIGINRIIEHYHPSILHFVDVTAKDTHAQALRSYNGMVITGPGAAPNRKHENTFEINPFGIRPQKPIGTADAVRNFRAKEHKIGRSFGDGLFGLGAGCTALHAAILLGGDPIYLLGYDYYEDNGRHFDAYEPARNANSVYGYSRECIETISRETWLPRIFNCNPRSAMTCFPHVGIESLLNE